MSSLFFHIPQNGLSTRLPFLRGRALLSPPAGAVSARAWTIARTVSKCTLGTRLRVFTISLKMAASVLVRLVFIGALQSSLWARWSYRVHWLTLPQTAQRVPEKLLALLSRMFLLRPVAAPIVPGFAVAGAETADRLSTTGLPKGLNVGEHPPTLRSRRMTDRPFGI